MIPLNLLDGFIKILKISTYTTNTSAKETIENNDNVEEVPNNSSEKPSAIEERVDNTSTKEGAVDGSK